MRAKFRRCGWRLNVHADPEWIADVGSAIAEVIAELAGHRGVAGARPEPGKFRRRWTSGTDREQPVASLFSSGERTGDEHTGTRFSAVSPTSHACDLPGGTFYAAKPVAIEDVEGRRGPGHIINTISGRSERCSRSSCSMRRLGSPAEDALS